MMALLTGLRASKTSCANSRTVLWVVVIVLLLPLLTTGCNRASQPAASERAPAGTRVVITPGASSVDLESNAGESAVSASATSEPEQAESGTNGAVGGEGEVDVAAEPPPAVPAEMLTGAETEPFAPLDANGAEAVVAERPLSEIMPELFVSTTLPLTSMLPISGTDALDQAVLQGGTPAREPVPISSLWQPASPVPLIESWSQTDNFLILGTDRVDDAVNWRTDVIMVVGLDRAQRRAAVFSIPRDLLVPIPDRGWGRINTVDFIGQERINVEGGGPALVANVIENTLGVPIQHWVRVEMEGFEQLVDAVGGVTIHLDCPFYEPIYDLSLGSWTYFSLPPGEVTLSGEEAHWYARLRMRETDFGRAQRQRQLLWALRDKMLSANLVLRLPELWRALDGQFVTDLSLLEIVELAQFSLPLNASRVHAGALTYPELQGFTSSSGGAVLRVSSTSAVQAKIDSIWTSAPMADAAKPEDETCPAPPPGAPIYETASP